MAMGSTGKVVINGEMQAAKGVCSSFRSEVATFLSDLNSTVDALFNATKFVCNWAPDFTDYLEKKRKEGKHYNVAISHACKKLVRVIYHLQTTGEEYNP